jgi:putative component of membrane protein insertase Oxa1/YidC/SpoIIIJ protein YidD/TM2 domain-containing membrane protein YozV
VIVVVASLVGCRSGSEERGSTVTTAAGVAAVEVYRSVLAEQWGYHCDFEPSCSVYGRDSIDGYGLGPGFLMTVDRLMRDHPFSRDRYDRTRDGRPLDEPIHNALFASVGQDAPLAPSDSSKVSDAERAVPGDDEALARFADRLFNEGETERAYIEYRRYVFLYPQGSDVERIRGRIVICLSRIQRHDEAIGALESLAPGEERTLLRALVLRGAGRAEAAVASIESDSASARLLSGFLALEHGDVVRARSSFDGLASPAADVLLERCDRFEELPEKSTIAAGIFSAALPGSGQAYAGRIGDGLMAFVINGLLIGGTVAAALNDEDVTAGVVGTVALGFYTGNVYGGVNAAERFNHDTRESFLDRARGTVRQNRVAWGVSPGAVAVYFGF